VRASIYQMRLSGHGSNVIFERGVFDLHFIRQPPIFCIVGEQNDVHRVIDVLGVPVGRDSNGAIVSVVGRFARTTIDVSFLKQDEIPYLSKITIKQHSCTLYTQNVSKMNWSTKMIS